jgi:hypothetical protein
MRLAARISALTDRRRRLDIDDDRVADVDQIVVRIGEERRSAVRRGPPRCRIGRRNELRRDLACCAKCRIVEGGQIFLDGTTGGGRRQTRGAVDAVAVTGVGLDQTGVDGKTFTADQSRADAALQHGLEQPPQHIAVAKAAMAVLREGRVVGH